MTPGHAYALTRMQARLAQRPRADGFSHLAGISDFGHFLQAASKAGFNEWLRYLGPDSGAHPTELSLRLAFRRQLTELANWLPRRWRPLPEWLSIAPDLPIIAGFLRGQPVANWVHQDPRLRELLDCEGHFDRHRLNRLWPQLADASAETLDEVWSETASTLLPNTGNTWPCVGDLLQQHLTPQPQQAQARLIKVFRRQPVTAIRITAFAGLLRMDFDFLRGQLCRRRLQIELEV